jgi:hypothetical protein
MKKIQGSSDFVGKEVDRLKGLVGSKATTDAKKAEFNMKLNILASFQ